MLFIAASNLTGTSLPDLFISGFVIWSMRYLGVHTMAQRKKKQDLVSVLIDKFMGDTLNPNRQTLVFSMDNSIKEQAGLKDSSSDNDFVLRSDYRYATVFLSRPRLVW